MEEEAAAVPPAIAPKARRAPGETEEGAEEDESALVATSGKASVRVKRPSLMNSSLVDAAASAPLLTGIRADPCPWQFICLRWGPWGGR